MAELDVLRTLADQVVPPPLDALRTVARRRSNRAATLAALGACVAATVATFVTLQVVSDDKAGPDLVVPVIDDLRPLTYAEGPTIHLGDTVVTMSLPVVELDLTDGGTLARLQDGSIWFTDGTRTDQVGTLGEPGASYTEGEVPVDQPGSSWMVSANLGGRAAWFEFPTPTQPVLVVYDTTTHEVVVDREPITAGDATRELPVALTERYVYWGNDSNVAIETPNGRYDLQTGAQREITEAGYVAGLPAKGSRRTLTTNNDGTWPTEVIDGIGQQLGGEAGQFRPVGGGDFKEWDGQTHRAFDFSAPPGFNGTTLFLDQWIDDDTVVLRTFDSDPVDLLVCHNSTASCTTAATVSAGAVVPGLH